MDTRAAHQRRGLGTIVARAALGALLALPDCRRVVVATNPANAASARFFGALGFAPIERPNYDGDPMRAYPRPAAAQPWKPAP
jgi:RimJ/RimL family protein N-acetyltransferase